MFENPKPEDIVQGGGGKTCTIEEFNALTEEGRAEFISPFNPGEVRYDVFHTGSMHVKRDGFTRLTHLPTGHCVQKEGSNPRLRLELLEELRKLVESNGN